jgi:hypothetical protein
MVERFAEGEEKRSTRRRDCRKRENGKRHQGMKRLFLYIYIYIYFCPFFIENEEKE